MPEFHSLEQPPQKDLEKLIRKTHEYGSLHPQVTFIWPIDKERAATLELIKTEQPKEEDVVRLLRSDDFVKRIAGCYLAFQIPKFSEANRREVLERLGKERDTGSLEVEELALQAFLKVKVQNMIQEEALSALRNDAKDARNKNDFTRMRGILSVLANFGEKALPILEELKEGVPFSDKIISQVEADIAGKPQEAKTPLPQKLFGNVFDKISDLVSPNPKLYKWLLSTRKPLFATPYTKELVQRLSKLEEISQELKTEFGDDFIGFVIYGGTERGHFRKSFWEKSDLDCILIARDTDQKYKVKEVFLRHARPLNPHHFKGLMLFNRSGEITRDSYWYFPFLFKGIFFGDRSKLRELQKKMLGKETEEEWERIRRSVFHSEMRMEKAAKRFGLNDKEVKRIQIFASLLRVPPPLEEAKKLIRLK